MVGRVGSAVFDFLVGDDWLTAAGVAALLAATGLPAWPLAILATIAVLLWSVKRAGAKHRRDRG